jgi:hypothetical protein
VRFALRVINVAIALVTLASALAVLGSDLLIPGYREHYRDALWFVVLYAVVQLVMVIEFARDGRLAPWLALAKVLAAYVFILNLASLWPYWRTWTPARYVYQLFAWDGVTNAGLFALIFLGRGAFNTISAMHYTQHWWQPLRAGYPLLGRILTAVPAAASALCVYAFFGLVRDERQNYSPEAQEVARLVYDGLDCDAVRANAGKTTTDLRRRGELHYEVKIAYDCALTKVVVRAEDGRLGTVSGPQIDCCDPRLRLGSAEGGAR